MIKYVLAILFTLTLCIDDVSFGETSYNYYDGEYKTVEVADDQVIEVGRVIYVYEYDTGTEEPVMVANENEEGGIIVMDLESGDYGVILIDD